ncbi:hypothetical protein TVAG_471060 [Trichomonas vaginalis G3]|uniref:Ubiquitin-like domain-containing protein n=1 Tax=Trichomonas vaginalis (strain ATCC PRA-98 / G3) TaxID=412133 RepID=A2F4R2_TRIV3|nr:nuclear protein localization 4 family [Trichomonas vaginalis G3]EAY00123.1 hypothetical protein TVAG_471060 [Trichomonas vaginalis G3]KAI5552282.1 nuclear protein localization 4 family [Trichomonas vaginalis G3]|eukprot:XP_001313052.1 hypothetical protein [Trichomonas vaginalis G3]
MQSIQVVRIRWKKGTEKVPVNPHDTIGTLIQYMVNKFEIKEEISTLIQDKTKTVLQKRIKLSSLDMENGELFELSLPSDANPNKDSKTSKPDTPIDDHQRNVYTLDYFKDHNPTIQFQKYENSILKRVLFPSAELQRIGRISNALHFNSTQIFLLYGTTPNPAAIRIHALSLPSQECTGEELLINESHIKDSHHVALACGLKFLGFLIISPKTNVPIAPHLLIKLMPLISDDLESFIFIRSLPTLKSMVDSVSCNLEAYSVSKQFIDMYRRGLFTGESTDTSLITKSTVLVSAKSLKEVDVSYFVTPLATKLRESWFPSNSFPYQSFYPTIADFVAICYKFIDVPNYIRFLDFNLLLFCCTIFDREEEVPLIARSCIARDDIPDKVLVKIEEMIDAPLRKLMN